MLDAKSELLQELWILLRGEIKSGITKQALLAVLLAILNTTLLNTHEFKHIDKGNANIGTYDSEGKFSLTEEEIDFLKNKYKRYFNTSIHFKRKSASPEVTLQSFKFHVNSRTQNMAITAREKVKSFIGKNENYSRIALELEKQNNSVENLQKCYKIITQEYLYEFLIFAQEE